MSAIASSQKALLVPFTPFTSAEMNDGWRIDLQMNDYRGSIYSEGGPFLVTTYKMRVSRNVEKTELITEMALKGILHRDRRGVYSWDIKIESLNRDKSFFKNKVNERANGFLKFFLEKIQADSSHRFKTKGAINAVFFDCIFNQIL